MGFYDFSAKKDNGQEIKMEEYKSKVVLVVNTASRCGLTPQLEDLEELDRDYKQAGLEILGFPCTQFPKQFSGSSAEMQEFCQTDYRVSFTMFEKIDVNGETEHPLFKYLKNEAKGLISNEIKGNFTKFLIDAQGKVIKRYAPIVPLSKIKSDIENLLKK